MNNKDDSIKAEVAELGQKMTNKDDSIETSLSLISNKTNAIEDAIKDYPGKEALCAYQFHVYNADQTITFDRLYVEINDNGGDLNIQTGKYTAGTAGVYEVTVAVGSANTADYSRIEIYLKTSSGRYQDNNEG